MRSCHASGIVLLLSACAGAQAATAVDLAELSIEELGNIDVTSLSKRSERLFDAPASVYVITRDEIRRSGVTSIPEALRLAPGVEVARNGTASWNISIRGFNNDLSNKLLVLIDGRSVYSPLYSGVFWDVQDTLLEDVERIEIIAGPGGTIWGANAVNGVINILTRAAGDTRGGYVEAGHGDQERGFAGMRYGFNLSERTAARGYLKYFKRAASETAAGADGGDAWHMARGGFRVDSERASGHYTLQGDIYSGREDGMFRDTFTLGTLPGPSFRDKSVLAGGNLLARWTHRQDSGGEIRLQMYYDYTKRNLPNTFSESRDTFDVEFQQHLQAGGRHDIVWGAGYRASSDSLVNSLFSTFDPARRRDQTYNLFLQDKIELWRRQLFLTVGSKLEHNAYTGFEQQPSVRLHWMPSARQAVWLAASRALRIPARLDTDIRLTAPVSLPGLPFPVYIKVNGNPALAPERLVAYEAGYRIKASETLSIDAAIFRNRYKGLNTTESSGPPTIVRPPPALYIILNNIRTNGMSGETDGGTLAVKWQAMPNWRLHMNYSYLHMKLTLDPGSKEVNALRIAGNSPRHQAAIHTYFDMPHNLSVFAGLRYVGALPTLKVEQYVALNAGVSWRPRPNLELALTGENLNNSGHIEYAKSGMNRIGRSVHGLAVWRF